MTVSPTTSTTWKTSLPPTRGSKHSARASTNFAPTSGATLTPFRTTPSRHRYGERVSTAFAESTVNAVVGNRFAKRQQMRWSKRGAHLMLQTRTRVLDDTLRAKFQRWYPGLFHVQTPRIAQNMTSLLDPTDFGTSLFVEGGRLGLVQNPETSVIVERPSAHFQRILSADPAVCLRQVREDMGGEMRSRDPLGL